MIKFYNNNVNDLFDYGSRKNKISINDIYAQVYNVSYSTAMKMAHNYFYG